MLNITWLSQASEDLEAIIAYIAVRSASAAADLDALIHDTMDRVAKFPNMGRPGRVNDTREIIAHPNYVIVYSTAGDTLVVVSVLHARQEYP